MDTRHSAGYVYVATNGLMPGLIKAGRTQTSVDDRLRSLYSTGVPCPFVAERIRFFVDCFAAESRFLRTLEGVGTRCGSREFFQVQPPLASKLLDELYRHQHQPLGSGLCELDSFEGVVEETFRILHASGEFELAEQTVRTLGLLPYSRRQQVMLRLLARVMEKEDERFSCWLIGNCGADPDLPIECTTRASANMNYYLTALESSIYLGLARLEKYLEGLGCDIRNSAALCYVIDTLLNRETICNKVAITNFGIQLMLRGINIDRELNLDTFVEAPRCSYNARDFQFGLFPRNSKLSCREVIAKMAPDKPFFAQLHDTVLETKS